MQKKLLLLAALISATLFANAQTERPTLSAGITLGAAVGPQASAFPVASSVVVRYAHPITEQVSIMATTGFSYYVSSDGYYAGYSTYGGNYTSGSIAIFWPVQVGLKAYVANRFFVQADVGISTNLNSQYLGYTSKRVAPLVSPAVGYTIPFGSSRWSLDLGLGYENRIEPNGGYSQINLRALFNVEL